MKNDEPGLSDGELAKTIERFFRTDEARRRHPDGSSLGLHISKSVAKVHGLGFEIRKSEFGGLEVEFQGEITGEIE